MNIKNRIFSLILAISLIVTSSVGTTVFGADWSGRWTFSSGSEDYSDNSAAADSSDVVQKDNSSAQTSEESESISEDSGDMWTYGEQIEEETVADAAANGDMFVYQDENENPSAENQNAEDESKGIVSEEKTLVYEDDSVIISVTGSEKDLPVGTNLSVKEILPDNDMNVIAYAGAITALSETLREQGESYSQAKLYDISLVDEQGREREPSGVVSVKFEYKDTSVFADIDKESIKVAHITEKEEEDELSDKQADDESNDIEELGGDDDSQTEENAEALEDASQSETDESILQSEEIVPSSVISEETLAAAQEAAEKMTVEIVDTSVELIDENQPVTVTFVTDSFSYYVVFGGNGSDSEPVNIGRYGWVRFATTGLKNTAWGFITDESGFPSYTDVNNRSRRIFGVKLWFPKAGVTNPTVYDDTEFEHPGDAVAQYYWVWNANNQVVIDEFEIPGYEVVHSSMHTAWNDANGINDVQGDGIEGVFSVRGFIHGRYDELVAAGQVPGVDFQPYDLNILNVYLKPLPTHGNVDTTHYVIRYVHADGSVSDGNEKELWNGNNRADFDQSIYCRDDEVYAGLALATGNEAIHAESGTTDMVTLQNAGKGYIEYNSRVDLAKVTIYYKAKLDSLTTDVKSSYDRDIESGKYYTGEKGLYTDKSVQPTSDPDGRHYLLNLESWYVDKSVSVGMVLDASGSMAWTSGIPEPIILDDKLAKGEITQAQYNQLIRYTDSEASLANTGNISNNMTYINNSIILSYLLNTEKTDNSKLNYNGYHYYLYDERTSVNEYVALGYWNGQGFDKKNVTNNNNGIDKVDFIQLSDMPTYAVENFGDQPEDGWYYVNSTGKTPEFLQYTGKSYEGNPRYESNKWNRKGAIRFFVEKNSDNKYELKCTYYSDSIRKVSKVYEKRYKMFTKNETLQDALAQFGTILLGASTVNQMAITRFSQDILDTDDTGATETDKSRYFRAVDGSSTGYLKLLNWTNSTIDVAAALNQDPLASGGTKRLAADGYGPGLANTYGYGLTGQTTTYAGVKAFYNEYNKPQYFPADGKKYIIIFTDGKDQHRNSNASDANEADQGLTGRWVRRLKSEGFSVVTVLMKSQTFNKNQQDYERTQNFLKALASYGKITDDTSAGNYNTDDNKMYFEADSNSSYELVQEFREIANRITSSLKEYSVIDYIDPRFDVTNDAGRILTVLDENGEFTNETNPEVDAETGLRGFTTPDGKKAYLGYDSDKKMFYVKWNEQTIPSTTVNSESVTPWSSQIRIQAKEDFLGGNDILTNGNDSTLNKVYYDGYDTNSSTNPPSAYPAKVFPQTSANPAILDEDLDYTEDTIYLGEAIKPADKFKWLFDTPSNDNLYLEYLKRYVAWGEYLGSDEFRQSVSYTSLDADHKSVIDSFVSVYDAKKDQIDDFLADGAEDIAAAGDDPESKANMTLTIPYYYLEDSRGNENQPGTMWHMLDRIGEISYTWEAAEGVPDPYIKRETTEDDPNPIVYTLKASYKADAVADHQTQALWLADQNIDGITPNSGQYFDLKPPVANDPQDISDHHAGTWSQIVGEGQSPVINKKVYLSELENADSDSSDIASTLVDKIYHYLGDAVSNTNGQKDYPFTVSDGANSTDVTLRIRKPTEDESEADPAIKLVYEWLSITTAGETTIEIVLSGGVIEEADLTEAAAKGYLNLSYTVSNMTVPDDGNPNTKNTKKYTITDAHAGKAIINLVSGSIKIRKQINKTQLLKDIDDNGGVVLEFKLKRTYTDPMFEPPEEPETGDEPEQDPDVTPEPESGDNTPGTGEKEEYWKLELVLGARPASTPTPEPSTTPGNGQGGENGSGQEEITYVKTITETITRDKINSLTADEDGYIVIIPEWATQRLPFGTYTVEETEAGDYTLDGITNISNESKMSAYVSVAEGGKSAVVYLNQVESGVPAEATIDASRTRLNAQEAILQVKNKKEIKTKLILTKKDSVDQSKLLKGVIFEIFTDAACTTKASNTKDAEGTQKDSFITDEAGLLIIDNLEPNKTYYLREKMAASGHYLLTGAIPIAFDADGLLSIGTIADTELRSHVWLDTDTTKEKNDMIVTNSPYYDLPSAGGPGSYIFTIIGVAICAITVLMKYRERTETGRA